MTLDQLISTWNNKPCDIDIAYGDQCWDIVEQYAEDVLSIPRSPWAITLNGDTTNPGGVAKNAWLFYDNNPQLIKYFDKIPPGQEQRGDITVYGAHGVYTEGHIAIYLGNGQVFEQNADPDGSPCHVAYRNITYRLGSLRRKEDMYGGKTAQQWANEANANLGVAQARESYLNQIALAAGVNPDKPINQPEVNQIINNIDEKNKLAAAAAGKFVPVEEKLFKEVK